MNILHIVNQIFLYIEHLKIIIIIILVEKQKIQIIVLDLLIMILNLAIIYLSEIVSMEVERMAQILFTTTIVNIIMVKMKIYYLKNTQIIHFVFYQKFIQKVILIIIDLVQLFIQFVMKCFVQIIHLL